MCDVDKCSKKVKSRGMCSAHYEKARREGEIPGLEDRKCSVERCDGGLYAKGLCSMHYKAQLTHGSPLAGGRSYLSPEEAFEARTEWQGDCLVWTGSKDTSGYGLIRVRGKMEKVHRYIWGRRVGAISSGKMIDHTCFTKTCVNIAHLRLATRSENRRNLSGPTKANTSGLRNVSWDKDAQKWVVQIGYEGRNLKIGRFDNIEEAGEAAREARATYYSEFAGRG